MRPGPITRYLRAVASPVSTPETEGDPCPCPEIVARLNELASRGPVEPEVDAVPSSRGDALTWAGVGWEA